MIASFLTGAALARVVRAAEIEDWKSFGFWVVVLLVCGAAAAHAWAR